MITAKDNAALMMIRVLLLFSSMDYVGVGRYPRNFAVTYLHKIIAIYHSPKDADL